MASRPWWQQVTALVSLSAGGAITGFSFVPKAAADLTSPTSMPIHLLALNKSAQPAPAGDAALRSAVVNVANYYLRLAQGKTPAEVEAIIWQHDSIDGVDHGASCAAFASLTLELAAQVVGQQSWVTGGTSYPWPLHQWADVRVDPNMASLGIISILQDAEANHRWHPLGDGYEPLPGDWVLFNGHVEVVTKYAGGVLSTIGGDSLPDFSVNAHEYRDPLSAQGVVGFVDNGELPGAPAKPPPGPEHVSGGDQARAPAAQAQVAIPGAPAADSAAPAPAAPIPGLPPTAQVRSAGSAARPATPASQRRQSPAAPPAQGTDAQQAFIAEVAPGAVAAQRTYGVPAAVTIAQAIDESGWGQSNLAIRDHNLFGIKGTGPAGSDPLPTQEYENGQLVTRTDIFRVYHSVAESIDDHGRLLATSGYYRQAMADRENPNAFAAALTGVYATDPDYGAKLIALMRQYNLYRYDVVAPTPPAATPPAATAHAAIPGLPAPPVSATRKAYAYRPASKATPSIRTMSAVQMPTPTSRQKRTAVSRNASTSTSQYKQDMPASVANAFITMAKAPLLREQPLYRDVASHSGIRWELLAACDWMQCKAQPRYSPVHGEKLGTENPDGTIYRTKSAALEQCANDLIELTWTVYRVDLTAPEDLSIRDLANTFAAFRWGGLLKLHHTSAMEFPYSVAGLTTRHTNMRWPRINEPNTPDKPGGRFRMPFGAVPIVLGLNYQATV
jgi:flagellum-specific peptidoglycan hydrolase FlgJ